jgi:hypothetical protein
LEQAVAAYKADEKWEQDHPLQAAKQGKVKAQASTGRRNWGFGGGLAGQLS